MTAYIDKIMTLTVNLRTIKSTKWHMHPAKTQLSLGINKTDVRLMDN